MASNPMGTCPLGGLWYTCTDQNPTFFGCCTSNPCNGVGCPASDLRAAGMGTASGNDGSYYPNVQCPTSPSGIQWWTCAVQTPSFQGCCISNPCGGSGSAGGCPAGQLYAAQFKSVTSAAAATTSQTTLSTSSISSLPSVSSISSTLITQSSIYTTTFANGALTTITSVVIQTVAPESTNIPSAVTSSSPPIAAIAGGAAGGIVVILIIAFLIWRCYRKRKQTANKAAILASTIESSRGPLGGPVYEKNPEAVSTEIETYQPSQPILKTTNAPNPSQSPHLSPGPPPSQPGNPAAHEIDSHGIHEVSSSQSPQFQSSNSYSPNPSSAHEMESPSLGAEITGTADTVSELPITPASQQGRWSLRRPLGLGLSGRGVVGGGAQGSPGSPGISEMSDEAASSRGNRGSGSGSAVSAARQSYTGWESYAS